MNNRLFCTILVVVICTVSIAHVAVAQETPFVITGYVSYANGTACDDPGVTVTNTGTGKSWPAENYSVSNYYRLVLAKGTDLDVNATLEFEVTSPDGSQSKIVESSIAQVEIKEGGRFEYNISLSFPSQQTWYFTDNTASAPIYADADYHKIMTKGTEAGMGTEVGLIHGKRVWLYSDPVADGDVTFPAGAWNVSYWVKTVCDDEHGKSVTTKLHGIDSTGAGLTGSPYAEETHDLTSEAKTVETVTTASLNTIAFTIPAGGRLAIELIWDADAQSDLVLYCNLKGEPASQVTSPTSDPSNLMPDLVIANQSVLWVDRLSRTFNVTYTVKNVGNGIASASKTNISVVNYDDLVPALSPGETHTDTVGPFDATFDVSNHYYVTMAICADCYDAVTESDEANNCVTDGIGVPHLNVSIESMDWVDEPNKVYNISYDVRNSGGAASTNVTQAYVYIDGNTDASATEKVGIMPKPPIDTPTVAGGVFEPFTMTGTSDTISVCVEWEDGKNCVEEVFVSDNQMPDLVIENHSVLWVDRLNRTLNVTYTVKNTGNGSANSSTTNISVVNYDDPVPALSSGESYTNTVGPFDATFDVSNFYQISINICANYYNTVTESDETNNCVTDGIGIPYLNISIESVDWVELNNTYNISYEVLNSGGAASTNVTRAYVYIDGNTDASATEKVGVMPKPPIDNPTSVTGLFGPFTMTGTSDTISVCVEWEDGKNCVEEVFGYQATSVFDTGTGTYPGISGTHNGTLIPDEDIEVNRLYTYACTGTGGHTEYVRIWDANGNVDGQGNWSGYPGDYHNVTISPAITLLQGHTYNYTIETGSYPQIVHAKSKSVTGGTITCTKFTDANGKRYTNCIPAIRLFYEEQ